MNPHILPATSLLLFGAALAAAAPSRLGTLSTFPDGELPDTLWLSSVSVIAFKDSVPSLYAKMPGYVVDSAARTVTATQSSNFVVLRDSAGLTADVTSYSVSGGWAFRATGTAMGYDASGREVLEHSVMTSASLVVDTTHWIWNHPKCPDELHTSEGGRIRWTVDADGNCLLGTRYGLSDSTTPEGTYWVNGWESGRLVSTRQFRKYGVTADTVLRSERSYGTDGFLSRNAFYQRSSNDSAWKPLLQLDYEYDGTRLRRCVQSASSIGTSSTVNSVITWSTTPGSTSGIGDSPARSRLPFSVVPSAGAIVARNDDEAPIRLSLADLQGRILEDRTIPSRSQLSISLASRTHAVAWRASGRMQQSSGILLLQH